MADKKYQNKKWYIIYKRVIAIICWTILTLLILIGTFLCFVYINTKINENKNRTPLISIVTILNNNMEPEIKYADGAIIKRTKKESINKGDLIAYYSPNNLLASLPTICKVEKVDKYGDIPLYKVISNNKKISETISADDIIGKVIAIIPGLGKIQLFIASKSAILIVLLIPALAIVINASVRSIKNAKYNHKINELDSIEEKKERDEDLNI